MGQLGIRSVLKQPVQAKLKTALHSQLLEYDEIERQAHAVATTRGWTLDELDPSMKHITNMMCKAKLRFGDVNSKAAAMIIQGNTRGIIKGYHNLNQYANSDERISNLSQKLLECEEANNRQMQRFL